MAAASPVRGWPVGRRGLRPRRRQEGQALVYGIFILLGSLVALFFLFNTGQIVREKTKLVNTADAVAYSAGVMHARALNFDAYANRALMANEVLIAQMVSVSSWSQYVRTHAENVLTVFPECSNWYSLAHAMLFYFGRDYGALCFGLGYVGQYVSALMQPVPDLAEAVVTAAEVNKRLLVAAQRQLHTTLPFARYQVMQEVASANYDDAEGGSIAVDVSSVQLTDDWSGFTRRYAGDERTRLAEVTRVAAYSDGFVRLRSWDGTAEAIDLAAGPACNARGRLHEVRRRGGTELIGMDEWLAADTVSFHRWRTRRFFRCRSSEGPIGWGMQEAHPEDVDPDGSGARLGGSPATNPGAHAAARASSRLWTSYSGLAPYWGLSREALDDPNEDPRLRHSVRLIRHRTQTVASEGRSNIPSTERLRRQGALQPYGLNDFSSERVMPGDVLAAVATSEVYFERPHAHRDNTYGARRGQPRELASLFNPYWHVRLVHSAQDVARARWVQESGS